jgi:hypothetical protein
MPLLAHLASHFVRIIAWGKERFREQLILFGIAPGQGPVNLTGRDIASEQGIFSSLLLARIFFKSSISSDPADQDRPVEQDETNQQLRSASSIAALKAERDTEEKSYWINHIYWKSPKTLFEDICTMGNCWLGGPGTAMIIEGPDGDETDFHERYIEDRVLGEGQFGVVRLVLDMKEKDQSKNTMACKVLRKGVVFKGRSHHYEGPNSSSQSCT